MKIKFDILQYSPCKSAIDYYENCKSSEEAWNNCLRGDWMLWIASMLGVDIKTLTLTKVHCALTVKHLMKDKKSINALKVALKFGNNKATLEELKIAADTAYDAAFAADAADVATYIAAYVADAADVTTHAADIAVGAANIAADAANAAYAADDAAYAADAAARAAADDAYTPDYVAARAAKIKNQKETADICRKYLTKAVFKKIK